MQQPHDATLQANSTVLVFKQCHEVTNIVRGCVALASNKTRRNDDYFPTVLLYVCSELVHTGANFIERSAATRLRFIRVTYIRPIIHRGHERHHLHVEALPVSRPPVSGARVVTPLPGLAYRTFTPAPVKVAMCSGQPEYESFTSMWQRARAWLNAVSEYTQCRLVISNV